MTRLMQMHQVLRPVCTTLLHRYLVMGVQFFPIQQVFAADWTLPALFFRYGAEF